MIISINTHTVYIENSSAKLLLHELNTNQSHILTDCYSNWMVRTIRPNKLLPFSLGRDLLEQPFALNFFQITILYSVLN